MLTWLQFEHSKYGLKEQCLMLRPSCSILLIHTIYTTEQLGDR